MPLGPAWVWTSIEMFSRSSSVAEARGSSVTRVSARVPAQPSSIAPNELPTADHIQSRRLTACPQQSMTFLRYFLMATPRKSMCSSVSGVKPVTRALCA